MWTLPGYRIIEEIYESAHALTFRARRDSDALPLIVKALKDAHPGERQIRKVEQEYELGKLLAGRPGIVGVLGMERVQGLPVLLVEDFGGESLKHLLKRRAFSVEEGLKIGIRVAGCLGEIHAARIIHKDINPANIIYNAETGEVKVIDFGISARLPRQEIGFSRPEVMEGTIAYIAPEQTGWLNRPIDFRVDYYALGATLYHLFTGKLPFEVEAPTALVRCHVFDIPQAPSAINPEIPPSLSDVVMKLLAKAPENRYQSAVGIKADLAECLERLRRGDRSSTFALGQRDCSAKQLTPRRIYGREPELGELLAGFAAVRQGQKTLALVHGHSGIGKTALVKELYKPLGKCGGFFISGKFDFLERARPCSAIMDAFGELIQQLAREENDCWNRWRERVTEALAAQGQILLDFLPDLRALLGSMPPAAELPPQERENRFRWIFEKLVGVFAREEHPLVLFLDDLQWADLASLRLLRLLLDSAEFAHFYLIGAYRDNEVGPVHPLRIWLEEVEKEHPARSISLQPLDLAEVREWLSDSLQISGENVGPLAELLLRRSDGNPFVLNELLEAFYREGQLSPDPRTGEWHWELDQLQTRGLTDTAAELMVRKLQRLPQETLDALRLAACLGSQFDLETLALCAGRKSTEVLTLLVPAVTESLLLPLGETSIPGRKRESECAERQLFVLRFGHDRIQTAAYSLIVEKDKPGLHLRIGELLRRSLPQPCQDRRLFDVVAHLNLGRQLLLAQAERDDLAELDLQAGRMAKASTAYDSAQLFLEVGIELLGPDGWGRQYSLALALHQEAAEAAFLRRDEESMFRWLVEIRCHARTKLDRVMAYELEIGELVAQHKLQEAVKLGVIVLKDLGVSFPRQPFRLQILLSFVQVKLGLLRTPIDSLVDLPELTDSLLCAQVRIMRRIAKPAYMSFPDLAPLITFKQMHLLLRYGHTPFSPSILGSMGLLLCGAVGDLDTGYRLGLVALRLLEKSPNNPHKGRTVYLFNHFVRHWKEPLNTTLGSFQEAYRLCLEAGDLEWASNAGVAYCQHLLLSGAELDACARECTIYSQAIRAFKEESMLATNEIIRQTVLNLGGHSPAPTLLCGDAFDEELMRPRLEEAKDGSSLYAMYGLKLMLGALFRRYAEALDCGEKCLTFLGSGRGTFFTTRIHFYHALAGLGMARGESPAQRRRIKKQVLAVKRKFKLWAEHAPMNHLHLYHLLQTEYHREFGFPQKAEDLYELAAREAEESGFVHETALCLELGGWFHEERNRQDLARTFFRQALERYRQWGASAKAQDLLRRFPDIE